MDVSAMAQANRFSRSLVLVIGSILWVAPFAMADWPGLLGPNRDGHTSSGVKIPQKLTAPFRIRWRLEGGQGYAGPAIRSDRCALYERQGESDVVRMVNAADGKEIWRRTLPATYRGGVDADKGPRSVPSICEESVIVYSAAGELTALDRANGNVRWTRSLRKEYQAEDGYFGAGSTPLVVGERIIVNVGGKQGGIVCVSASRGETLWKATDAEASYASPILIRIEGTDIALVPTRLRTYAIEVETGKKLWDVPFGQRGTTVNAATPIVTAAGDIFLTASYGIGSLLVRPSLASGEIISRGDEFTSQYATPVHSGGFVFGSDGREDMGGASFKRLDARTGSLVWSEEGMPICHTLADSEGGMLLVGIDGQVWGIDPQAPKFQSNWKAKLPPGTYRSVPALVTGCLLVKSTVPGKSEWIAVDLD